MFTFQSKCTDSNEQTQHAAVHLTADSSALLAHLTLMKSSLAAGPFNCFLNTKNNERLNSH